MPEEGEDEPSISEGVMVALGGDDGTIKGLFRRAVREASEILWRRIAKRFIFLGILLALSGGAGIAIRLFGGGIRQHFAEAGLDIIGSAFELVALVLVAVIIVLGFLRHFDEATHPAGEENNIVTAFLHFIFGMTLISSLVWVFIQASADLLIITATGMLLSGSIFAGVALTALGAHDFRRELSSSLERYFGSEED